MHKFLSKKEKKSVDMIEKNGSCYFETDKNSYDPLLSYAIKSKLSWKDFFPVVIKKNK